MDENSRRRSSILLEAEDITTGARREAYGDVVDDFARIAALWSVVLGCEVTPRGVALCMVQVKMSREIHKHARDNCVDGAGYWKIANQLGDVEQSA